MIEKERKFVATPEKGEVSALLIRPAGASHLLVLGHGASTTAGRATSSRRWTCSGRFASGSAAA
jgi:hypothetical protein